MVDLSGLNFFEVLVVTFVPAALAATQLRAKGVFGFLAVAGVFVVCIAALVLLEGAKQWGGFFSGLVGLAVGGAVSDWRERERTKREKEVELRARRSRFVK
jgi:hypothetical protein